MAQTGFTPIQLYSSSTPTNAPSASNLTNDTKGSELAINIADKNLFFKDSTNAVNTVPIRQSGTASNGWLSATDWNTFNNKQPAGAYVTSVTGTAPVVSSGGTTPAISMAAATTSVNGYLTSTDWNTFNGKQAALVSGTNIKTVNGTTLLGSGDLGTIGVAYGGTGLTTLATGRIPYGNGTSALNSSASLSFDGTTLASPKLALSTSSSGALVDVATLTNANGATNTEVGIFFAPTTATGNIRGARISAYQVTGNNDIGLKFYPGNGATIAAAQTIWPTGGVSIGNTTDPGAGNLLVTGSIRSNSAVSSGYSAGAGGTVTQATSKSTAVTINKPTGQITMNNAALTAGSTVTFKVNNTVATSSDTVILSCPYVTIDPANYRVEVVFISSNEFNIRVTNISGGSLSEALQINFCIVRGAVS